MSATLLVGARYVTRRATATRPCAVCGEPTRLRATLYDADGDRVDAEQPLCDMCAH